MMPTVMLPPWVKTGLTYGLMALSIGTTLAAIRALVLTPLMTPSTATMVEFGLGAVLLTGSGLWLMRQRGPWTTNTALYFGGVGAAVYGLASFIISWIALGGSANAIVSASTLTHGALFPLALSLMALGPAVMTQRA